MHVQKLKGAEELGLQVVSLDSLVKKVTNENAPVAEKLSVCRDAVLYDLDQSIPQVSVIPAGNDLIFDEEAMYFPSEDEYADLQSYAKGPFNLELLGLHRTLDGSYMSIAADQFEGKRPFETSEQADFVKSLFNGSGESFGKFLKGRRYHWIEIDLHAPQFVKDLVERRGPFVVPAVFYQPADSWKGKFSLSLYQSKPSDDLSTSLL